METEDVSKYVKAYRDLRNKKATINKLYKEIIAPVDEMMGKVEMHLLEMANDLGVNSFATPHGTAYKNKVTYVEVADWDLFQNMLVEKLVALVHDEIDPYAGLHLSEILTRLAQCFKQSDFWDYLTRAVNKTEIVELAGAGKPVPGIVVGSEIKMGFRSPTTKRS